MQHDGGLRGGQLDGLALVLVLAAAALLLVGISTAWEIAGSGGWSMMEGSTNTGVIGGGRRWNDFFRALAAASSPVSVALLGAAVAVVGRRSWAAAGRAGHAAAVAALGLGLVLAGQAGLAAFYAATGADGDAMVMSAGTSASNRFATGLYYAATSFGLAYAAWCAFSLLPVATSKPRGS
jgi:hypothetical protein